ncbi:MAG TPA: S24 family peptidase [Chthoniobacteraceae bacterium]|nr:S24 family peptidase [Chthoniobacteraceae bacterium]
MIERAGSITATVAIKETIARKFVAISERDAGSPSRYAFFMLSDWLREALDASNTKQAELSRQLTKALGRSVDRAAVNKMLSAERAIAGDELLVIERVTGFEAPKEIQVPLKGKVGAGQAVYAIDDGDDKTVPAPAQARPGTIAVEVSGESMFPAYEDGTYLYYSKLLPPDEMVNRRAVVQLGDGRIFVKIIRRGSTANTWTLQSLNTQYPDMLDEVVEWAAPIDWIRPR